MSLKILGVAVVAGVVVVAVLPAAGDASAGRTAFEKRCTGCHALDRDKVGPRLGGVVGRKAGTVSSFAYSEGVKRSEVVWDEAVLDRWLTEPEAVIPDNDMSFRLNDAGERAAIIAYLKEAGK